MAEPNAEQLVKATLDAIFGTPPHIRFRASVYMNPVDVGTISEAIAAGARRVQRGPVPPFTDGETGLRVFGYPLFFDATLERGRVDMRVASLSSGSATVSERLPGEPWGFVIGDPVAAAQTLLGMLRTMEARDLLALNREGQRGAIVVLAALLRERDGE